MNRGEYAITITDADVSPEAAARVRLVFDPEETVGVYRVKLLTAALLTEIDRSYPTAGDARDVASCVSDHIANHYKLAQNDAG